MVFVPVNQEFENSRLQPIATNRYGHSYIFKLRSADEIPDKPESTWFVSRFQINTVAFLHITLASFSKLHETNDETT